MAYKDGFSGLLNSKGLAIFMLILALIIFGFLIANAVYFHKIKTDPNQSTVSQSDANTMMWINIVLSIIMFLFIVYYAAKSLYTRKAFESIQQKFETQANKAVDFSQKNIADPLKTVYDAGVKAGEQAYAKSLDALNKASTAAAVAYTALAEPSTVSYTNPSTGTTEYLYHQGSGIYKSQTSGKLYICGDNKCNGV